MITHNNDPEEKCHICGKVAANKRAVQSHIRTTHQPPRFKCTICEKLFRKPKILKVSSMQTKF